LEIGKTATPASIQADPSLARRTVELGTVSIPVAGVQTLQLRPEAEGWQPIQLHKVLLIPE
jgi:hypothetical protein